MECRRSLHALHIPTGWVCLHALMPFTTRTCHPPTPGAVELTAGPGKPP